MCHLYDSFWLWRSQRSGGRAERKSGKLNELKAYICSLPNTRSAQKPAVGRRHHNVLKASGRCGYYVAILLVAVRHFFRCKCARGMLHEACGLRNPMMEIAVSCPARSSINCITRGKRTFTHDVDEPHPHKNTTAYSNGIPDRVWVFIRAHHVADVSRCVVCTRDSPRW